MPRATADHRQLLVTVGVQIEAILRMKSAVRSLADQQLVQVWQHRR